MRNDFDIQVAGVLNEYERALRDGATEKATRIRHANPDLKNELAVITNTFGAEQIEKAS